jgi:hypothetical protein
MTAVNGHIPATIVTSPIVHWYGRWLIQSTVDIPKKQYRELI